MEGLDGKDFEEIRMFWGAEKNRAPLGIRASTNSPGRRADFEASRFSFSTFHCGQAGRSFEGIFKLIKGPKVLCH